MYLLNLGRYKTPFISFGLMENEKLFELMKKMYVELQEIKREVKYNTKI